MIHKWFTAKENKMTMGVDSLREHTLEVVLPELYKNHDEAQVEAGLEEAERMTYKQFKNCLGISTLAPSTIWRWMQYLGYEHSEVKKCYYVDNHKAEENVNYRNNEFLPEYWKTEIRSYRWTQLTVAQAEELEKLPLPTKLDDPGL